MSSIRIHQVMLRGGVLAVKSAVPLEQKVKWVEVLINVCVKITLLYLFINPQKVPQMADTDNLFTHFTQPGKKPANITLSGLVLNEKELERGMIFGVVLFCKGVSAVKPPARNTRMTTVLRRRDQMYHSTDWPGSYLFTPIINIQIIIQEVSHERKK